MNSSNETHHSPVITQALEALRSASRLVVFTGAGMSAESGIPTFREAKTGLWSRFSPEELASPEGWAADPARVWAWYEWRRALVARAQPNAGHLAVAQLARLKDVSVITQNVDDLHERAGSTAVVHLHGSLFAPRCDQCGEPGDFDGVPDTMHESLPPPDCPACGRGSWRPGVVWFGEPLPVTAWDAAVDQIRQCQMLLVVGTSGSVYPAAGLVTQALRRGTTVLEINPDESQLSDAVTLSWRASAAQALPTLLKALQAG